MKFLKPIHFMVVILACAALLGLSGTPTLAHENGAHVRFAHLSPTAPAVDIYLDGKVVASNVTYKMVTDYIALEVMEIAVSVVPAGGKMEDAVNKEPFRFTFEMGDNKYYTLAAVGNPDHGMFELVKLPADAVMGMAMEGMDHSHEGMAEPVSITVGTLEITGAFARPSGEGMNNMGVVSAAYMTIKNTGDKADRLLSAEVDPALVGIVELHETVVVNEVAKMEPRPEGFEIAAGDMVELKPGGKHIMLMDVKSALEVGKTVKITLKFESGTVVEIEVPIMMVAGMKMGH